LFGPRPLRAGLIALQDTAQAVLIVLSSAMIFVLVLTRYLLGYSDASVEEIARYFAIWGTFLGISTAHRRGFSIRFSLLEHLLPNTGKRILASVVWMTCAVASFGLAWAGWELAVESRMLGEVMQTGLRLPLWIPRASVGVGAVLLGIEFLVSSLKAMTGDPSPASEHGGF